MLAQSSPPSQFKDKQSEIDIPTEEQLFKDDPDPVVLSAQIAVRLKKIQQTISLDYNDHVQKYISYNTHEKRKTHIAKMLGRAKKFFPIFEPILAKYGIPDEMKYLAVVESALNPFALSKAGASGPWQFMYSTALRYNLSINKRVDERRDPYLACDAAARYLLEMYNLYGNWQLSIASYNCGAGNVNKAIKKAGGSTNFWDIRSFLPAETRAYVPSFIAMVYAMKYADRYGIDAQELGNEKTHRITVRQKVTLNDLENTLTIPRQILIDDN
ncbi:MAG TPA: lytic transglycosylase domain-containing protein, partial [Chitinophagales bacterium]|nr:lytic transglycosylase domain-containing protein [Chitinophagales bacterium]